MLEPEPGLMPILEVDLAHLDGIARVLGRAALRREGGEEPFTSFQEKDPISAMEEEQEVGGQAKVWVAPW